MSSERIVQFLHWFSLFQEVYEGLRDRLSSTSLTPVQFFLLYLLKMEGSMCQRALADMVGRTPGNVTLLIDQMEEKGWVERRRSAEDRRYIQVCLTRKGESLLEKVTPLCSGFLEGVEEKIRTTLQTITDEKKVVSRKEK